MSGNELRRKRPKAGIPGHIVCLKAGVGRSRLSDIEREYVQPSDHDVARIDQALDELISAKQRLLAAAVECGWPPGTF